MKFTRHSICERCGRTIAALRGKLLRAGGFRLLHQRRNGPPGLARLFRIDAVEAEHHRGIEQAARIVADLERRAGPGREIAVAGAVDEDVRAHRLPPGLGLHHQRIDARLVMHHHAGAERMKQDVDLVVASRSSAAIL